METKYTEYMIQQVLVNRYITGGFRTNLCVPNVSFGFFTTHEADLVVVSKAWYLTEYEIKRTWQDFLNDFKKHTNHFENKVSRLFYVVPEFIADRCIDYLKQHEWQAPYNNTMLGFDCPVGLISYNEKGGMKERLYAPYLNVYTQRKLQSYKLTESQIMNLARLGSMRYWGMYNHSY